MKIIIPLNSLIRHIGEDEFKEILESSVIPALEKLTTSLNHLVKMRQYDIVLELSTEEFDTLMLFKNE